MSTPSSPKPGFLLARFSHVHGRDSKKPVYVFYPLEASPEIDLGTSITCLKHEWEGKVKPVRDQPVKLYQVQLFPRGWRAGRVCPIEATS